MHNQRISESTAQVEEIAHRAQSTSRRLPAGLSHFNILWINAIPLKLVYGGRNNGSIARILLLA